MRGEMYSIAIGRRYSKEACNRVSLRLGFHVRLEYSEMLGVVKFSHFFM